MGELILLANISEKDVAWDEIGLGVTLALHGFRKSNS